MLVVAAPIIGQVENDGFHPPLVKSGKGSIKLGFQRL